MVASTTDTKRRRKVGLDRLENAAAVAAILHERMMTDPDGADENWPSGRFYAAFGGFPGWWSYLAVCADVFNRSQPLDDDWIRGVGSYTDRVWDETVEARGPLSLRQLELLMEFVAEMLRHERP